MGYLQLSGLGRAEIITKEASATISNPLLTEEERRAAGRAKGKQPVQLKSSIQENKTYAAANDTGGSILSLLSSNSSREPVTAVDPSTVAQDSGGSWWTEAGSGVSAPGIIGAVGGAGAAAGSVLYHMQLDRARSRDTIKRKSTQMIGQSAAGAAVSGASVGMMFGGPVGAIFGGLLGGAAGAAGGFFGSKKLKKDNKKLQKKEQARTAAEAKALAAAQKAEEAAELARQNEIRRKRNAIRSQGQVVLNLLRQHQAKIDAHGAGTAEMLAEEIKDIVYASQDAEGTDLDVLLQQLKDIAANMQQLVATPPAQPVDQSADQGGSWTDDLFGFSGLGGLGCGDTPCAPCAQKAGSMGAMFDMVSIDELFQKEIPTAPWPANLPPAMLRPESGIRGFSGFSGGLAGLGDYNDDMSTWLQNTRNQNRAQLGLPPIEKSPGLGAFPGGSTGVLGAALVMGLGFAYASGALDKGD
jgi:hypothetical protein